MAIIGSGPAGLSAAYHLARKGIKSTIFEALPKAGGMLRVGIPEHRLPREVLDNEIELITNLGVDIKTEHAARAGPDRGRPVRPGVQVGLSGHRRPQGDRISASPARRPTACDRALTFCARSISPARPRWEKTWRSSAAATSPSTWPGARCAWAPKNVTIVYRRTRAEMPAWEEEIAACEAEGVDITYLSAPQEVIVADGRVVGLRCIRMELTEPDSSGRKRPVPIPGSEYELDIDQLIPAIGQRPDLSAIEDITGIDFTRWGTTEVDPITYATGRDGVFAGGDVQTGPWVAIGAIAAGKEAAESIVRYLDGRDLGLGREPIHREDPVYRPVPPNTRPAARAKMPELPVDRRQGNFNEVELGYEEAAGKDEAHRCLNCGYCCECYQCVEACGPKAVTLDTHAERAEQVELQVGSVILAPGFQPFDPSKFDNYSYAKHPNVITSIEMERHPVGHRPDHGASGAHVRPKGTEEDRLVPVRGIPGPEPLRQRLLLLGVLHVRRQGGGHRQGACRRRSGLRHLLHGHADPRQGFREVLQRRQGQTRGPFHPKPGAHGRPDSRQRRPAGQIRDRGRGDRHRSLRHDRAFGGHGNLAGSGRIWPSAWVSN